MKINVQLIRDKGIFKLVLLTRTMNGTEIDHVKIVDLDQDITSSMFMLSGMFEVDFDGIDEAIATEAAIEKVKKQKEEAAARIQEAEVVEAEVVEG